MPARPVLFLSFDRHPDHDWLIALELGRIDEGQPEGSWRGHSERLGFLHDGPDGRCIGFRLDEPLTYDADDAEHEELWRVGPRFDVPLLGLRDVSTNEVIVGAIAHFGERRSHNRELFGAAVAEEDRAEAFALWQRCLESGDSMAHYALGYTAFELGRHATAYQHLRHYAEIAPRMPWAQAWYGRAAGVIGQHTEAYEAFHRALQLEGEGGEGTEAGEWLASLAAAGELEAAMERAAGGRAWTSWEGGARLGGDPRVLVDWPGGPLLAELDLEGGEDGEAYLQVEVAAGTLEDVRALDDFGTRWFGTRDGRVWIALLAGPAGELEPEVVDDVAEELVRRAAVLRARAAHAGVGAPLDYAGQVARRELDEADAGKETGFEAVVFGEALGQLVFAFDDEARELAAAWSALQRATTWGELRELAAPDVYRHCVRFRLEADGEPVLTGEDDEPAAPADQEEFSLEQVSTIGDGEYPQNPIDLQQEWMPEELLALGTVGRVGMIGRDFVWFDLGREEAVVAGLEAVGYRVHRDDELVQAACNV